MMRLASSLAVVVLLSACGGGGGSGGSSSQPVASAPSVTLSASASQIVVGSGVTLSWSSSNASSCTASGGWSGSKATSGSEEVVPDSEGSASFSLSCSGAGGSGSASTAVDVLAALEFSVSDLIGVQAEDTSKAYSITLNANRDPLLIPTLTISSPPDNGLATGGGLGLTYQPNENYFGADSFEFTVEAEGVVASGLATIDVTPVNDAPVVSLSLQGEDQNGFTIAEPTVNFALAIDDVDNVEEEITISVVSGGTSLEFSRQGDDLMVALPLDFAVGPTSFEITVSDSEDSVSNESSTWVIRSIQTLGTDSQDRLSLLWGNAGQSLRPIDYVIVLDGLLETTKAQALEMLGFYFAEYLSNGKPSLQTLIDRTFNVYVMDFLPGPDSNLSIATGCSEADEDIFCIGDAINAFDAKLAQFSAPPTADYISVVTGVSGRGVNRGNFNIQPLLNEPDEGSFFGTPNYTLRVLKHEFGHAFMRLGDDYTADFLLEDDEGNKVVDMTDRLPGIDGRYANITLQDPNVLIKWDHQVGDNDQNGTLPGRDVTDDESNSAVGAWPGCYVHDAECFRTTYNNIMNGDYTTSQQRNQFYASRILSDSLLYDPVGEEAFIIATIRNYLEDWFDMGWVQNEAGDYAVCTSAKVPEDLFRLDWYQDGQLSPSLKAAEFELGEQVCVPMERPTDPNAWSSVGFRINPVDTELFSALVVEDSFDEFYDVYEGIFSGVLRSGCPLYDWHSDIMTERYCRAQSAAYSIAESRYVTYDTEMKSRTDWVDKYGDIAVILEYSGLGEQVQFNWAWW